MKKTLIITFLPLIVFCFIIASCNDESTIIDSQSDENLNFVDNTAKKKVMKTNLKNKDIGITQTLTKPNRHVHKGMSKNHPEWPCARRPHDCYPTIYVYPNLMPAILELDNHIAANTVHEFFNPSTTNYELLFPGIYGKSLDDLRNEIVTLRKEEPTENTVVYYLVMSIDTNLSPSYMFSYEWEHEFEECEDDCDESHYIYRY